MGEVQNVEVEEDDGDVYPPWSFSWVERGKLAIMACPFKAANLRFLVEQGIKHLVTLSAEKRPPSHLCEDLKYTDLFVKEFQPPTLDQINTFIDICRNSFANNEIVGVHCRMGRGRAGVMAACYLVKFKECTPESAISAIRIQRPGSVETYDQEIVVKSYFDSIRGTIVNNPEKSDNLVSPLNKERLNNENNLTDKNRG